MPPKEMFPLMKVQKETSKKENSPPFLVLQNQSSHEGLPVLEGLLQRRGVALFHRGDKDTGSRSSGKYSLA